MNQLTGILALALISVLFIGCTEQPNASPQESESGTAGYPSHNSRNSVDWNGTYHGILPCADCEGLETVIHLHHDHSFQMSTVYLGKSDEVFQTAGIFQWSDDGGKVTLQPSSRNLSPTTFMVGENRLIQLDKEGNRITGKLAELYVLRKNVLEIKP